MAITPKDRTRLLHRLWEMRRTDETFDEFVEMHERQARAKLAQIERRAELSEKDVAMRERVMNAISRRPH